MILSTFVIKSIKIICIWVTAAFANQFYGQNTKYNQFWSEIEFNRTLNEKWSLEFDLANSLSSSESSKKIFENNMQKSFRFWANYYLTPRWKLSAFLAYYDNKDVPEIGQFDSPEIRLAIQGAYYFHKIGYSLSTRSRIELRYIRNQADIFEDVYRFRQQIKYLRPLNNKMLRKNVVYVVFSDEIFFKSGAKVTGESFFDRNRFNAGAGYLFTDDIQIEAAYVNEFLPRNKGNQSVNALSITIIFNNLLDNLKK